MGRVPDLKRLTAEDFPSEQQPLVSKIGFIINSFHEQVRSVLNRNIDFENLSQELQTLSFTTDSTSQPLSQLSFRSNIANRVQGILPIRVIITSSNTQSAVNLPVITWSQDVNIVTITNISGLAAETTYQITLLTL